MDLGGRREHGVRTVAGLPPLAHGTCLRQLIVASGGLGFVEAFNFRQAYTVSPAFRRLTGIRLLKRLMLLAGTGVPSIYPLSQSLSIKNPEPGEGRTESFERPELPARRVNLREPILVSFVVPRVLGMEHSRMFAGARSSSGSSTTRTRPCCAFASCVGAGYSWTTAPGATASFEVSKRRTESQRRRDVPARKGKWSVA